MAYERLKDATLPHALSEVVADLADLLQKEFRLAKAEISSKISTKLGGGIWMSAAGVLGLMAVFIVLQALIFAIASTGIAMHWSCLIVAAGLVVIAAAAFFKGRADAQEDLTPDRTIHQINRDISTVKEQLS
jgi:Putative Actinobacterial Holin-X, holin superfamily III